jgi:hypothetical protein
MFMSHPCRFDLEQWMAGELDPEARGQIEAHVQQCGSCASFVRRSRQEQEALLARLPAASFALRIETLANQAERERKSWLSGWGWKVVLAGAAVGLILLFFWFQGGGPAGTSRWMGSSFAACQVYVQGDTGVTRLTGDVVRSGESVRFELTLPADRVGYAVLLGKEGERVFPLLPAGSAETALLVSGVFWMPGSVKLDGAGAPVELLVFVRSAPYSVAELLAEVARDGALAPGLACQVREKRDAL